MSTTVLRAEGVGIRFARGSRRERLRGNVRSALLGRRRHRSEGSPHELWALRDVSLDLTAGTRLAVCGANGSGKTTLMRLLGGIYRPDEGALQINGATSAMLSLGAGINHQLSGRDNVYLVGALYGLEPRAIGERYEEIRDFAEIDEAAMRTPVRYYSSGMRSRLGFSIAVTLTPEILLIDEVLAVGDLAFRKKSSEKLSECAERARCVVLSSHSVSFLKEHCDTAIWLDQGRAMTYGEAKIVLDEYVSFMAIRAQE
jgi:ABC-type polysaccharide/polyol phosphate transport system ATPase subunit